MTKAIGGGVLVGIVMAGVLLVAPLQAAPTPQQRTKARVAETVLKKAASLAKAKKFKEAGAALKQAQDVIVALSGEGEDGIKLTAPLRKQLASLHSDLELEGIKLAALPPEPAVAEAAKPAAPPAKPGAPATPATAAGSLPAPGTPVSFTKHVVPLFTGKCGGCHVRGNKGAFSMLSYDALMKGSKDGIVLAANNSGGSRLIQLIKEGDMPRGGGKVSPEELAMLCAWIDQGAKFDGTDPKANIADPNLVGGTNRMAKPDVDVQIASGKETIHFATDIAPVLVDQCYGCHGSGRRAAANYDMDIFKGVLQGGDSGTAVKAGSPADSMLIKKLRGTAADGVRMPKDKPALSEEIIAKFEKWISEGAKFDGYDPTMPLTIVVAMAHAEKCTHEELSAERAKRAAHDWKLVLPDGGDEKEETENFVIYGNTGKDSLKEVAKQAEIQAAKLQKVFKLSTGPLVKGRTAIFVFDKKYDYGEVGRMLENRDLPSDARGHWRYNVVDSNIYILPAKNNEYSLSGMLGQQIAAIVAASQGHVPHWFAEGSGRAAAVGLDSKEARYRIWDDRIPAILGSGTPADSFIKGSGEDSDILSYGFVKFLRTDANRYQTLLNALRAKTRFDAAFSKAYGGTVEQVAGAWAQRAR